MGAAPIPVSVLTSRLAAPVVLANIATSIPYRQYCFALHSCRQSSGKHRDSFETGARKAPAEGSKPAVTP